MIVQVSNPEVELVALVTSVSSGVAAVGQTKDANLAE